MDPLGNLYVAELGNKRIRKITPGGTISTFAGDGVNFCSTSGSGVGLQGPDPLGVATDAAGNVYIADVLTSRVCRVGPGGAVTIIAGNGVPGFSGDNGSATNASLRYPEGLVLDAEGELYIVDRFNYRVRKVTPAGIITTVAGNGIADFPVTEGRPPVLRCDPMPLQWMRSGTSTLPMDATAASARSALTESSPP